MIVGLEIAATRLAAAFYDRYAVGRTPPRQIEIALDGGCGTEGVAKALGGPLRKLREQIGSGPASVAVAIPTSWCLYRRVHFPFRSAARIRDTIRYSLEGRVPGAVEDYSIEPMGPPMPQGSRGAWLLVSACPTGLLEGLLLTFKDAGIDPCVVQPAAFALAGCLSSGRKMAAGEPVWVIRADGRYCEVMLLRDDRIAACHAVTCADDSPEAMAGAVAGIVRAEHLMGGSGAGREIPAPAAPRRGQWPRRCPPT